MKFWKAILTLVPATILFFMDQAILPVALPSIQKELGATDLQLQWSVNAYILAIALFLLLSGKLSDRGELRKMYSVGIISFVISSILCGMSQTIEMLIFARALQGVSAALMMPTQNAAIRHLFPQESFGKATGCIVSIGSIFLMLSPLIGGYFTEHLSWRWIFWINPPIGILGLFLVLRSWPHLPLKKTPIDFLGFCFFAISIGTLTFFFMQVSSYEWISLFSLICLLVFVFFFSLLFLREKKVEHPFLEFSLFKKPLFAAINISVSTGQTFSMVGVFWLLYFQQVLGYSPLESGFLSFVSAFPVIFSSPLAGYLSDRFTSKLPVALGYLCLIYTCFFLGFFPTPSFYPLILSCFVFGMGIPFILTPSFATALTAVPKQKIGLAMSSLMTVRMISGSMGLSLMYLVTSSVYLKNLFLGEEKAWITSFSALHFSLGFFVILSFMITFFLKTRKSLHKLPEYPGEGWD